MSYHSGRDQIPDVSVAVEVRRHAVRRGLPVFAFARHVCDLLPDEAATDLIDSIRFFLEGKTVSGRPADLSGAENGFMGVRILARSVGLTNDTINHVYHLARQDLAASAFALDAPGGLFELLADLDDSFVAVVAEADDTGVTEVLTAIGVAEHIDAVMTGPVVADALAEVPACIDAVHRPERLMVVGDRWTGDLADAHAIGARTALIDRFHRGKGRPDLREAGMTDLVPGIRRWAQQLERPR